MREAIYTIPIHDVFNPKCGCPICSMRDMLENRCVEYIMGAAMMEPDIRIETNKYGFCIEHFRMMKLQKNRLSLALMLETHLDELMKKHIPPSLKKGAISLSDTCYVCKEIEQAMDKLIDTTLKMYSSDSSFKNLILEQEFFCYPHYELLCKKAKEKLSKKESAQFIDNITELNNIYLKKLRNDVHGFSTMFDYRNSNNNEKSEDITLSLERAIKFLTSR